jgi:crotonobetaine/carnitine-CoA ligase
LYKRRETTPLALLEAAVDARPEAPFLTFDDGTFTYAEARSAVLSLAQGLRGLGVERGDVVAGMLDNNADAVFGWMAANALGATWLGVNTALKGDFLSHILSEGDVKLLLSESDYASRLARIETPVGSLRMVLYRGDRPQPIPYDARTLDEARADAAEDGCNLAPDPFELSCLIATGGTTGPSKLCMLQHSYLCNFARHVNEISGRRADEISLNPLPAYHMNLLTNTVISSLLVGGSGVVLPKFSLSGFWPSVEKSGARVVNLIGSMISLVAMMEDTEESIRCFGQLRAVMGAPFPAELQDIWRTRFGIEVAGINSYGLTEAVPMTSVRCSEYAKPGSAGKRNDDFNVRLVDDDDLEVPVGAVGEIVCRPNRPGVMFAGYWKRPAETLATLRNLWFHSGDLGRFDEEGFLFFVDRKKDYLRRRGENISSVEVERTLLKHEALVEVAAHAVPSEVTEDDLKITAVLATDAGLAPAELFEWATERLPYFALPRYIEFRAELPKSPLGRVLKYQLRHEGKTDATWDREAAGVVFEKR